MNSAKNLKTNKGHKDVKTLVLTLYSRFLPLFYILESSLKQRIFEVIETELGKNWFTAQLDNTVNDPIFRSEINLILNRKHKNYTLTPEKLVAESGLGLWVEFFGTRVYKLAKGRPIKIFPHLPATIKRVDIYTRLNRIKDFRNLLVHSRVPIISNKSQVTYLNEIHDNYKILLELIEWMGESPLLSQAQFDKEVEFIRLSLN